jgi:hypothetical protein
MKYETLQTFQPFNKLRATLYELYNFINFCLFTATATFSQDVAIKLHIRGVYESEITQLPLTVNPAISSLKSLSRFVGRVGG